MSDAADVPLVVAALVAILVVAGAAIAFLGSLGLVRLSTFYDRVHPPTMGATMGVGLMLVASMLLFSALESRPVLHELVIAVFMVVTTPVTFMLLVRAARHRDAAVQADEAAATATASGKTPVAD